jgi:hypothetical protein
MTPPRAPEREARTEGWSWPSNSASPPERASRGARHDRRLRGPWALFFLGVVHDESEPFFVGHDSSMLLHAAHGLWGDGWGYAGLWASKADREHTLREVAQARATRLRASGSGTRDLPSGYNVGDLTDADVPWLAANLAPMYGEGSEVRWVLERVAASGSEGT